MSSGKITGLDMLAGKVTLFDAVTNFSSNGQPFQSALFDVIFSVASPHYRSSDDPYIVTTSLTVVDKLSNYLDELFYPTSVIYMMSEFDSEMRVYLDTYELAKIATALFISDKIAITDFITELQLTNQYVHPLFEIVVAPL